MPPLPGPLLRLRSEEREKRFRVRLRASMALTRWKSGSRRRAEAALWRAAKEGGLPHSKTLRDLASVFMGQPRSFHDWRGVDLNLVRQAIHFLLGMCPLPRKYFG